LKAKYDLNNKAWQFATLILLSMLWGSSFILMKKGLRSFTHTQVASFRILFSYIAFLPVSIKYIRKISKKNFGHLLEVGIVGTIIPAFLFTKAQTQIESSLAGVLNSLAPLFTLIIGLIFYNSKARFINAVGIFLGLIGAVGLILKNPFVAVHEMEFNWYGIFIVLATMCYGFNANHIKYRIKGLTGLEITSLAFFIIGPVSLLTLFPYDFSKAAESATLWADLGFISLLAVFASVLALTIFNTLIQYSSALFAASVTYIIPIFAIMWGVMDGEQLSPIQLVFIGFIILGVYLVNKKKKNKITV